MRSFTHLFIRLIFAVTVSFLWCGCRTGRTADDPPELSGFSPEEAKAARLLAEKFAGGFAESLKDGDFAHWRGQIPPDSAAKVGEREFTAMKDELRSFFGDFDSASYLGEVISGNLRSFLWKLSFVKTEGERRTVNEIVYFVRVFREEGKAPAISGFGVRRF